MAIRRVLLPPPSSLYKYFVTGSCNIEELYRVSHSLPNPGFLNNFTTNEDIATTTDTHYRQIPLHFSHNERTPIKILLQYLHWC